MTDYQASSGSRSPTEMHTFTKMPQCTKCAEFHPTYEYVAGVVDVTSGEVLTSWSSSAEALKLTCTRCGYVWLMVCASDHDLA